MVMRKNKIQIRKRSKGRYIKETVVTWCKCSLPELAAFDRTLVQF